jgi:hypothetical protein
LTADERRRKAKAYASSIKKPPQKPKKPKTMKNDSRIGVNKNKNRRIKET